MSTESTEVNLHLLRFDVDEVGRSGPACGTAYDWSTGCRACGTGSSQIGPLHIALGRTRSHSRLLLTLSGDVLVDNASENRLIRAGCDPRDFRDVIEQQTGSRIAWKHLLPQATLPKFELGTNLFITSNHPKEVSCDMCHRDGHFDSTSAEPRKALISMAAMQVQYGPEPSSWPLFFRTWECFAKSVGMPFRSDGPHNGQHLARPKIVCHDLAQKIVEAIFGDAVRFTAITLA